MKKTKLKIKKLQGSPYGLSLDQNIGNASFASVYRAYNLQDPKEQLAVKVISSKDQSTSVTIKSQIEALKALPNNPHLVNCKKVIISSQKNFYLIMQYCRDGNLQSYMYRHNFTILEDKIWFFLKQFCEGYKVLYDTNIIHRDLKPQNILLNNGDFKIADFGLSRKVDDKEVMQNVSAKGTPLYMAPQLHFEKAGNAEVDVYSLGVILYRMSFNGKHPFYDSGRNFRSINEYFQQLMMKKLTFPPYHKRSKELVDLIKRMLTKQNTERVKWSEIFKIDRINKAVRGERKKQLHPIEQFKKSIIIANKSITSVRFVQENLGQSQSQQNTLVIEQTFNKTQKTKIQKKLYHYKLLYTLISHTNSKIEKYLLKKVHPLIQKRLSKVIITGFRFGLFLIKNLQDISGDWNQINQGQVMNFEDIFQNDRVILVEDLKKFYSNYGKQPQTILTKPYINGEYDDALYTLLSQFSEYSLNTQSDLNVIIALLIDIYDLVLKINQNDISEESKSKMEYVEDQSVDQFYSYLNHKETINESEVVNELQRKGLYII